MNKSKFDFHEIVCISSDKKSLSNFNGFEAIVLGKSQSEEDPTIFAYAINILNKHGDVEKRSFAFEDDLQSTGKKAKKEDFYSGDSVRVRVDPETGEGDVVDDEE